MARLEPPVNLDRVLRERKWNDRIQRVGIELEGGWDKLPAGVKPIRDGSVVFPDMLVNHLGEVPSPPMEVKMYPAWLKVTYPHHVNETCGMHVHMSFKTALTYSRLMVPTFPSTVVKYVSEWAGREKLPKSHPLWARLAGKCDFCKLEFFADEQAKTTQKDYDRRRHGNRYQAVNYCYGTHGTVEIRLLPMMDEVDQAQRAIQELLDITNGFLLATAKKEEKVQVKHVVEDVSAREDRKIYV